MKNKTLKNTNFKIYITILTVLFYFSCKEENKNNTSNSNKISEHHNTEQNNNSLEIEFSNPENDKYKLNDVITISVKYKEITDNDTINLFFRDKILTKLYKNNLSCEWNTENAKTGTNVISCSLNKNGKKIKKSKNIIFYSDTEPEKYGYKVKKVYKHDHRAYTQGLFYQDGFLYEATGLTGESSVRKVDLETGDVIQSFSMSKDIFGEGITYFDNKIVQISWRAGRGFVYNFEDFKLITEFSIPGEGWGIVYDGKNLIMSNGTPKMYVLDPNSFTIIDEFEVYDNEGPVKNLNELEYINGEIFANIYQYSKIARIDPKTGKVNSYIDLDGILPMNDYTQNTDVLNGIAYDKGKNRILVTGKRWPKLFEIELVKK